jgi:hypothetical protein
VRVQERIEASKELVEFMRAYTLLIDLQLKGIRGYMAGIVGDVMSSIENLNKTSAEKKRQALSVIVSDGQKMTNRSVLDVAKQEQLAPGGGGTSVDAASRDLLRASGLFSKHMEAISTMDDEVRKILYQVVGALSADDIMGQRLKHVTLALANIGREISQFIANFPEQATLDGVCNFRDRVLTDVYKSYSMEAERLIFHEVFGEPVRSKPAAGE